MNNTEELKEKVEALKQYVTSQETTICNLREIIRELEKNAVK